MRHPPPQRAVLFDLDGTLLDSFPSHLQAYHVMFERLGLQVSDEAFFQYYSPNWLDIYRALGVPPERWAEADAIWLAEAARHNPRLFPGAVELLEQLQPLCRLGLVTAGSRSRVVRDLQREGILRMFEVVVAGSDVTQPKPHPEGLLKALAALELEPAQAVYIGDTRPDYEMAAAAGVQFIGIPGPAAGLTPDLPCKLVSSLGELPALLL